MQQDFGGLGGLFHSGWRKSYTSTHLSAQNKSPDSSTQATRKEGETVLEASGKEGSSSLCQPHTGARPVSPTTNFSVSLLLPSNLPPLPGHSYLSPQYSVPLSSKITPSFLPLGFKAQRGASLAWRHTASPLPGLSPSTSRPCFPPQHCLILKWESKPVFFFFPRRGDGSAP